MLCVVVSVDGEMPHDLNFYLIVIDVLNLRFIEYILPTYFTLLPHSTYKLFKKYGECFKLYYFQIRNNNEN